MDTLKRVFRRSVSWVRRPSDPEEGHPGHASARVTLFLLLQLLNEKWFHFFVLSRKFDSSTIDSEEDALLFRLFAGCPITEENKVLLETMSPERYLSEKTPPHLILHGTADEMVHVCESERYYDALIQAGIPADLVLLEGAGHCDQAFSQAEVQNIILEFFRKHLQ